MTDFILRTKSNLDTLYAAVWARMEREGLQPLRVAVKAYKRSKTLPQLQKVHALLRDFAISGGRSMEDTKVILKFHIGYTRIVPMKNGKHREVPKSFGDATIEELSVIIDQLITLAIEWNVELSDE